jgi:hypothetical protein
MFNAHLTIHGFIGPGSHKALVPPSVVPAIIFHLSADTLLGYTIGAKYSKTVIGPFGFQFIGKGNDSGLIVPHISIPPNNILLPITIAFGISKPMFSASKVHIDVDGAGLPLTACCNPWVPLSLNQACNDPCNYPSDIVIAPNSVVVGLTLGDIIGGLVHIAIDSAISAILNWGSNHAAHFLIHKIGGPIASRIAAKYASELAEQLGEASGERFIHDIVENLLERPAVQFVDRVVHKAIDWVVEHGVIHPIMHGAEHALEGEHGAAPESGAAGHHQGDPTQQSNGLTGADGSNPNIHNAD